MAVMSRRGVFGTLLFPLTCRLGLRGQSLFPDIVARPAKDGGAENRLKNTSRQYRADAVILLLGLPIYRRTGVGTGKASIEETGDGAATRRTLFFGAGSDPKRARGVSRLGWMHEVVVGTAAAPSEISYLGVLTSSPEESLEHARKAVADTPAGKSLFNAVSGHNAVGRTRSAIARFEFASKAVWSDRDLIDKAQSMFGGDVNWRETPRPDSQNHAPPTFLTQVAALFRERARRSVGRYVYNEQEYAVELDRREPGRGDRLVPVHGKIRNLRTGVETRFRVWLEDSPGSILPMRIDFQPRSFVKLSFTAEQA